MIKEAKTVDKGPGFYKKDGENLLFAPNRVTAPKYELTKEDRDTYTYPVDGWYWFEEERKALEALNE